MKMDIKLTNDWRKSLIFSRKERSSEPKVVAPAPRRDAETLESGLSAIERIWNHRSPLSTQLTRKARGEVKTLSSVSQGLNVSSRSASFPVRRSTLIDIVKSKRILGEVLSRPANLSA